MTVNQSHKSVECVMKAMFINNLNGLVFLDPFMKILFNGHIIILKE